MQRLEESSGRRAGMGRRGVGTRPGLGARIPGGGAVQGLRGKGKARWLLCRRTRGNESSASRRFYRASALARCGTHAKEEAASCSTQTRSRPAAGGVGNTQVKMDWTEAVRVWAKKRSGLAEAELFVRRLERLERKRDRHDGDGTSCTVRITGLA